MPKAPPSGASVGRQLRRDGQVRLGVVADDPDQDLRHDAPAHRAQPVAAAARLAPPSGRRATGASRRSSRAPRAAPARRRRAGARRRRGRPPPPRAGRGRTRAAGRGRPASGSPRRSTSPVIAAGSSTSARGQAAVDALGALGRRPAGQVEHAATSRCGARVDRAEAQQVGEQRLRLEPVVEPVGLAHLAVPVAVGRVGELEGDVALGPGPVPARALVQDLLHELLPHQPAQEVVDHDPLVVPGRRPPRRVEARRPRRRRRRAAGQRRGCGRG